MSTSQETSGANAGQIETWNGTTGEKWVAHQDRLDRMLAPFGEKLLEAAHVRAGEHVLDIGCGCGVTTLDVARPAGAGGHALGVDISAPMIARARDRAAAEGSTATFELADASSHAFAPGTYDLVVSRFGVMFFDDPVGAFANLHTALKQTGRLVFVCWRPLGENAWVSVPLRAALAHVAPPAPPPPGTPGPFAFADKAHVTGILESAGFREIALTPFDATLTLGASGPGAMDEALLQTSEIGPVSRLLADQPDEVRARVRASIREALAEHLTANGMSLGGAVWIVTARA